MPPAEQPNDPTARMLDELGDLIGRLETAVSERRFDDAQADVAEVFAAAGKWASEQPTPELLLSIQGSQCEEKGEWAGAEASYRSILALPDVGSIYSNSAHRNLARLCEMLGREDEALDHARQATSAIRLPDLEMLLAMALSGETHYLLRHNLLDEAEAAVAEMFTLLEDDFRWDQFRARAHILRTRCKLACGNANEVEADLARAWTLLEPMASMLEAAGLQNALANYWSAKAALCATRGDNQGAIVAWREAVQISGQVATLPQLEGIYASYCLTEMLKGLAAALAAGGQIEESREVAEDRAQLLRDLRLPLGSGL